MGIIGKGMGKVEELKSEGAEKMEKKSSKLKKLIGVAGIGIAGFGAYKLIRHLIGDEDDSIELIDSDETTYEYDEDDSDEDSEE